MMKKYWWLLVIILIVVLLFAVLSPKNPEGVYVAKYFKKTIDTIYVYKGGRYERAIYNMKTNDLIFRNEGKWTYKDDRIKFYDFFPHDDELVSENYCFDNVLLISSYPLEKLFVITYFSVNDESSRYLYFKLFF